MFITGLGTATPPRRHQQRECWEALQAAEPFARLSNRSKGILKKVLLSDSGIATRHLALDPLSEAFDAAAFHQALKLRQTAIKQVLLGGEAVVGVGNIYASEALFLAGIRPTTKACRISKPRSVLLHRAIQQVLTQAVTKGGSTLKDFSNAHGEAGHFQLEAMVYDRSGLPCKVCAATIKSMRQGQRSTFYCANCQKP